jgi:hypothetical protein
MPWTDRGGLVSNGEYVISQERVVDRCDIGTRVRGIGEAGLPLESRVRRMSLMKRLGIANRPPECRSILHGRPVFYERATVWIFRPGWAAIHQVKPGSSIAEAPDIALTESPVSCWPPLIAIR